MHPDLSVVHCTAMDCSTFDAPLVLETPLTGGSYGGLYSSIGIGTDGFPIIAYSSGQGPNPGQTALATIHCATANCSSHESPVLLDVCGQCGSYASLITGADGLPAIAYQGIFASATVPKFVHCGSLDCSAHGAPALLDNRGGNPLGTSITVGGDGMPIVSYDQGVNGDGSSGDLAFVHCNSLDCALKESPVLLAKNFAAGPGTELTSITVGNDGEPIVSYLFFGPLNDLGLKVAHCANVLCAPPLVRRR